MTDVMSNARQAEQMESMSFDEAVGRVAFLRALRPAERDRLRPYAEIRRLTPGESIWAFDDPMDRFVFLVEGHAKLTRPCEIGREVIIDVGAPGELLCGGAVSSFSTACCTCVAMDDDVVVVSVPRRDLMQVVEQNATAAAAFVRESTGRDMRLGRRIVELASGQVEQRIATLLLRLADQIGVAREGSVKIPLHLSRQDLADLCGTTLETAIRTMSRLAREEIVTTAARGFTIHDRSRLERMARGEPRG